MGEKRNGQRLPKREEQKRGERERERRVGREMTKKRKRRSIPLEDDTIVGSRVQEFGGGIVGEGSDEFVVSLDGARGGLGVALVEVEDVSVQVDGEDVLSLPEGSEKLCFYSSLEGKGPACKLE